MGGGSGVGVGVRWLGGWIVNVLGVGLMCWVVGCRWVVGRWVVCCEHLWTLLSVLLLFSIFEVFLFYLVVLKTQKLNSDTSHNPKFENVTFET